MPQHEKHNFILPLNLSNIKASKSHPAGIGDGVELLLSRLLFCVTRHWRKRRRNITCQFVIPAQV